MNTYTFDQLSVGMHASFSKKITEEDMNHFLAITQDTNPLHTHKEFAQEQGFPERVVYGMLTASLLSTLAGVYLPGKYSIILSTTVQFQKPVFMHDELQIQGTITEKREFGNLITITVSITRKDEQVSKGTILVKVLA